MSSVQEHAEGLIEVVPVRLENGHQLDTVQAPSVVLAENHHREAPRKLSDPILKPKVE